MTKRICLADGCGRQVIARGLCTKHYQRLSAAGLPPRPTAIDRLMARVSKSSDCWEWTGPLRSDGYGEIWVDGSREATHRFSWRIHNGPVPPGMLICHHCDNRKCLRPSHLFVGTHQDNASDAASKGRVSRGDAHYASKLSTADVAEIRKRRASGETLASIAASYPVGRRTIGKVVSGKRWSHVA